MIQEDRELLAELGRLNTDVVPLAMKIMDESVTVTAEEQYVFAKRLVAMGRRLEERAQRTAAGPIDGVVEGKVVEGNGETDGGVALRLLGASRSSWEAAV
ncbi:MAG: hypothetical protein M3308_04825 [Actinomycetota bacterium]|nr:hypothetical protein [Actinomycetota bacterium]